MLFDTKEKQDLYVAQTIKNLVCDEVAFNTTNRTAFTDWHHFKGVLLEEEEETLEALWDYQRCLSDIWKLTKMDAENIAFEERTLIALEQGWEFLHEAVQMQAVLLKAYKQLVPSKRIRPSVEVEMYKFEQTMKEYNKAPTTTK